MKSFKINCLTKLIDPGMVCVLCAVQSTAHNTHAILGHAATPPHNKL